MEDPFQSGTPRLREQEFLLVPVWGLRAPGGGRLERVPRDGPFVHHKGDVSVEVVVD